MLGKILRAGKGGYGQKYKIDVQVTQLENLPTSIKKCRVVWARSAKVQITDVKDVRGSVASFKQTLTQVTTMYRDKSGKLETKEYEFKVQVPGKSSSDATVTIGKAVLDMAKYCREETTTQNAMLPITFKVGGTTTGYLKMVITTIFLGDANDDGLTEVSGMTGLTSNHGSVQEQDLEGFGDEDHAKFSKKAKSKRDDGSTTVASSSGRSSGSKPEGARRRRPLPPMAEEEASDLEEPEPAPAKLSKKKSHSSRQSQEPEPEEEANPFARKIAKPSSKRVQRKVWEDDEDVSPLNSDMSDSEKVAPSRAKASSKSKVPEESLDEMKSSLFATKKPSSLSTAAAGTSSGAAVAASSSKATSSKSGKTSLPPPVEEEDDDSLRNDLFSSKTKAATTSSKVSTGKAASAAATALGAAAVGAAAVGSGATKHKSKSAPPLPPPEEEAEDYYDDYGTSASAAPAYATGSKSRSKAADASDAAVAKGLSGMARAGSMKTESAKGGSSAELEQLRQRLAQLERQLADEHVAKEDLNQKMQKYVDKIADLEDQLAEADVTELYTQMKEMEDKHQAEIKAMEDKYQVEIKELMERHLAEMEDTEVRHRAELEELQEAARTSRRGSDAVASAEELKRLQAELREQEALLKSRTAKLEAEQATANAARQAAEAKLAEANKLIDESLLVATRHQQENKALQEEVARLKRRLEDASMWDASAAAAAVTSAAANGRRSPDEEDELEELREKVQELQEENARLQKLNEVAQQAAVDMLHDIHSLLRDVRGAEGFSGSTGSSHIGQLAVGLRSLCDAYSQQSAELREMEARLSELSQRASSAAGSMRGSMGGDPQSAEGLSGGAGAAKVKPHELLARVHQLTAERDALQERLASHRQERNDLAATQRQIVDLQQQVDKLAAEKEAVERFKVATIADLRRQNDELRNSLRSMSFTNHSPRTTYDDSLPGCNPNTPGDAHAVLAGAAAARQVAVAGDGQGNWLEFETLVAQLKADRVELRHQVDQLKAEKALLGKQMEDLRSSGGAVADPSDLRLQTPRQQSERFRFEQEWEQERAQLQAEIARLQAQVAEFSEADAVIKEWSDYADGLMADKARLEEQVQQLTQQLGTGGGYVNDRIAEAAERRADDWQRRAMEAQRRIEEFQRIAGDSERRALDAEGRLQELQRYAEEARRRAEEAEQRAEEARVRAMGVEQRAEEAERRASAGERRARDAECRAEDFEQRAWAAERRAKEAESKGEAAADRACDGLGAFGAAAGVASVATTGAAAMASTHEPAHSQPADTGEVLELRHEISRLEASLSGLRVQLMETNSRSASARDELASSSRTRHRDLTARAKDPSVYGRRQWTEDDVRSSAGGSSSPNGGAPEHGWHAELEELRARNASLEATVAGLQANLAAALQEVDAGRSSAFPRSSRRAERQFQEAQSQLAAALKEKADLEGTVASLRAQLEDRIPSQVDLVGSQPRARSGSLRAAAGDSLSAATLTKVDAEVTALQEQCKALEEQLDCIQKERGMLTATVDGLRTEVERLQEEKADAEATAHRLSAEMEELAEALDASNNENERLSLEVLNLRDQVEQLEGGGEAAATRSQSARSLRSTRAPSSQSSVDGSVEGLHGHVQSRAAERELAAARVAARELILQVAASQNAGIGLGTLGDGDDLAQALKSLRSQIAELQKQSRTQQQAPTSCTTPNAATASNAAAVAAAEVQLARATARIDELEQLLEDAEIENQHLTEQLEECLTSGRKGPDSVGSVAEECQSSYGGSAAGAATGTSNPYSYGHANTLTLSAFEQRVAMAEGRRDELAAALDEANATNRRLEADVAALRQQLATGRRGQDSGSHNDFDRSFSQVPSRSRGSRSASDSEENYKKRIEELQAGNRKLEAVCDDLEDKANAAQGRAEKLQADLEEAKERVRELEASVATLQTRLEEERGPAGGRQKFSDLEARTARLAREKAALEEQLEEERAARQELEDTLKDKLDRDGDDEAAETVAAFEVKYNRLKERYKMLEESSQEEIDELQDQLTDALSQVAELQRQIKQVQGQLGQNRNGSGSAGAVNLEEVRSLRAENERLVQQLVAKTMELAELSEREITIKRELARLHEINMKLAQKATSLEAQVAMAEAAAAKTGKGGKK